MLSGIIDSKITRHLCNNAVLNADFIGDLSGVVTGYKIRLQQAKGKRQLVYDITAVVDNDIQIEMSQRAAGELLLYRIMGVSSHQGYRLGSICLL